jgi:hypothetical protein
MAMVSMSTKELLEKLDMASDEEHREIIRDLSFRQPPVILKIMPMPDLLPVYKVVVPHHIVKLLEFFLPFRENFHISANEGKLLKCRVQENAQIPERDKTICQTMKDESVGSILSRAQLLVNSIAKFMKMVDPRFTPDPKFFGIERYLYGKSPRSVPVNEFVPTLHQDDYTAIEFPTVTTVLYYYRYRHNPKEKKGLIGGNLDIFDDFENPMTSISTDSGTAVVFNGNVVHAVNDMSSYKDDVYGVYRDTFVFHFKRCSPEQYRKNDCGQRTRNPLSSKSNFFSWD